MPVRGVQSYQVPSSGRAEQSRAEQRTAVRVAPADPPCFTVLPLVASGICDFIHVQYLSILPLNYAGQRDWGVTAVDMETWNFDLLDDPENTNEPEYGDGLHHDAQNIWQGLLQPQYERSVRGRRRENTSVTAPGREEH